MIASTHRLSRLLQLSLRVWRCASVAMLIATVLQPVAAQGPAWNYISGTINTYKSVVGYNDCSGEVKLDDTVGLHVGDRVLIIQMVGARSSRSESSSHGTITDYHVAGNFEFAAVASFPSSQTVALTQPLLNYYEPYGLQLIRVPQYSNPMVSGVVSCPAWNGSIGGVVVLEATGSVGLTANIDVSGKGFGGGNASGNNSDSNLLGYTYAGNSNKAGTKGRGIDTTIAGRDAGRGCKANGGGGGNAMNAGGGGGANGGAGGCGGKQSGADCCGGTLSPLAIGGAGGRQLNYAQSIVKVFMGGGGGGGHRNNSAGTSGGAGGGLVIIRTSKFDGYGGKIIANGDTAAHASNDGAGGGGAGGAILLSVGSSPFVGTTVGIEAKGGRGGDAGTSTVCHGPGGGAGGGVVWFTTAITPTGVTVSTTFGANGQSSCAGSMAKSRYVSNDNSSYPLSSDYGAQAGAVGIVKHGLVLPGIAP